MVNYNRHIFSFNPLTESNTFGGLSLDVERYEDKENGEDIYNFYAILREDRLYQNLRFNHPDLEQVDLFMFSTAGRYLLTSKEDHNHLAGDYVFTSVGEGGGIFGDGRKLTYRPISEETLHTDSDITYPVQYLTLVSASNFTDEENPELTYKFYKPYNNYFVSPNGNVIGILKPNVDANSLFTKEDFLIKRELTFPQNQKTATFNYTLELTAEERALLRSTFNKDAISNINFAICGDFTPSESGSVGQYEPYNYMTYAGDVSAWYRELGSIKAYCVIEKKLTFVGAEPTLTPTVKDINSATLALTGNENIIVKHESIAEFSTGAVASKGASIVSQSVQCGSVIVNDMFNGIIDNAESENFLFNVVDSRGLQATTLVSKTAINYVKPTCYPEYKIELQDKTNVKITVSLTGSFFSGSFGLAENTMLLEMRYGVKGETIGEWQAVEGITYQAEGENKYSLSFIFDGIPYKDAYIFQTRITDKLNIVQSEQYIVKLYPIFDWSNEDFNFNVPVKLNGETVLRHNEEAGNTVLSASGGHIYLRPNGTDETYKETVFYPDGSIKVEGAINITNALTIDGNSLGDFVVETGEAPMGTNGTWYWQKWASGKAECWGCRNFGNMAITSTWGILYRSEVLTQELPDDVFKTTPDVININIVSSNFGGWICKHESEAPSAVSTGGFIFVRPASATATPTYIGFHVIGLWK